MFDTRSATCKIFHNGRHETINSLSEVVNSFMVTIMEQDDVRSVRRIGRPLSFDRDAVLQKAMLVFWRHGYENSSIAELTATMGITSPSIYAAFGDKRGLFREAVSRYLSAGGMTPEDFIAEAASARDAARGLLEGSATAFTGADTPPGCLLATSAISCSAEAADVQDELAAIRRGIETRLRRRIEEDIAAGVLPSDLDASTLAGFVMSLIQGMSTLARDGASRQHLLCVAEFAMQSWAAITRQASHP